MAFVSQLLKKVAGFLFNHRYHLDDIIAIIRPFIYVYAIVRCGNKSYTPVKISFLLDIVATLVSLSRLVQSAEAKSRPSVGDQQKLRQVEKRHIMRRIWTSLLLYLIRDPIFQDYTHPIALKVFTTLRISPKILGLVLAIVSYYRYYAYIA